MHCKEALGFIARAFFMYGIMAGLILSMGADILVNCIRRATASTNQPPTDQPKN